MMLKRRELLRKGFGLAAGAGVLAGAAPVLAFPETSVRRVGFNNLHTNEILDVAYWENGAYIPDALDAVNLVLRDWRNGDVHVIEPHLLDLLVSLSGKVESKGRFEVISGYRSPATNAMLHEQSAEVAVHSLHMEGMAIDIRMPSVDLTYLRDAAIALGVGGVGYYPSSDFVHTDVGRVRTWSGA
ncbi:MAG TPA: DUF882 domain-containing protein [Caulobacteraceae bacterium]|jgi:uncharacterized protein YcbK (DUF882 family)|nr:DUF882 domain-containing protein [Caulobacteraceae bacterium]